MGSTEKKGCELCSNTARMFCESDQASLCWDCDQKVHAANFLVAKHSRTLLCNVCTSPTPWKAAGPNLGPTLSVCHACAVRDAASASRRDDACESRENETDDGEYYSDTDFISEEDEEEEEEGENQVVPWSVDDINFPAPAASFSCSEEYGSFSSSKRTHDNPFESEDEEGCCSSRDPKSKLGEESDGSLGPSPLRRPLKMRRMIDGRDRIPPPAGTDAIVERLRRLPHELVATHPT